MVLSYVVGAFLVAQLVKNPYIWFFFNSKYYSTTQFVVGWILVDAELQIQRADSKSYMNFWLYKGSDSVYHMFEGQLSYQTEPSNTQ